MTPDNWIAIGSVGMSTLVTGVGLYFGPRLAVQNSLKQFRSQKWHEKQELVYTSLLEKLGIGKWYLHAAWERRMENKEGAPGEDDLAIYRQAMRDIKVRASTGDYLISTISAEALAELINDLNENYDNPLEQIETCEAAIQKCLDIVRTEAKSQLMSE